MAKKNEGKQFWGCTVYPECNGTEELFPPDAPELMVRFFKEH